METFHRPAILINIVESLNDHRLLPIIENKMPSFPSSLPRGSRDAIQWMNTRCATVKYVSLLGIILFPLLSIQYFFRRDERNDIEFSFSALYKVLE